MKNSPSSKLILLAEDEPDFGVLLLFHLQNCGFRTLATTDGCVALSEIFHQMPDLIMLDLMLPGMHGHEICQVVKTSIETRHIPIMMLSALSSEEDVQKGFELGADEYVVKPCSIPNLLQRVQKILRTA